MTKLIGFLWSRSRFWLVLAVFAGVIGGAGGVALLALMPIALHAAPGEIFRLGFLFAALCVVTIVARVSMQVAMIRVAHGSVAGLVRNLCERILLLPLTRFEANDPGAITAVLTEDVVSLTNALSGLPLLFINMTVFVGCFLYLTYLSPVLLLCTLVFAGPAILTHQLVTHRAQDLMRRARKEQDALVGHFRALVDGFKELKLHADRREAFLEESIRAASDRVRARNVTGLSVFAVASGWGQFLYFGYMGFLIFALPSIVEISRDTVAAAVLTVIYAMSPLDGLLNWMPVVARAGASLRRIEELGLSLEAVDDPHRNEALAAPAPLRQALELKAVTHTYPGEPGTEGFTLGPVSLSVYPGEMVFLVGGNGSGKTTLVKLLTGLYPAGSGSIHHDRRVVEETSVNIYRQLFTVVFADGYLFPTLLGLNAPDLDTRAGHLLSELGLDKLVTVENGEFSTTDLSQGQRKRLALLAACLEDRPVMVLDEWASYQDPVFKKAFYLEILPALKARGKTLIVISHDEDYFFVADRVVHLSSGMVTDRVPETFDYMPDDANAPDSEPLPPRIST